MIASATVAVGAQGLNDQNNSIRGPLAQAQQAEPEPGGDLSISNGDLILYVEQAGLDGIGTFTIQTENNSDLLYGTGDARTSYLTVQINGTNYATGPANDSTYMNQYVTQKPTIVGNSIITEWELPGDVLVRQNITLSGELARFDVTTVNQGEQAREINTRYLFDYQVDIQDGSPVRVQREDQQVVLTNETQYENPTFDSWKTLDQLPEPTLVGRAQMETQPDRVSFVKWPRAVGYAYDYPEFDTKRYFYTPGITDSPESDSAGLLYWELGSVSPGNSETVTTFYGTGDPSAVDPTEAIDLEFTNQPTGNNSVIVDSVFLPEGGFVTIQNQQGDVLGVSDYLNPNRSVLGVSDYLESETPYQDIVVPLDRPINDSQSLIVVPHRDTNGNQEFDFEGEGSNDGPYTANGEVIAAEGNRTESGPQQEKLPNTLIINSTGDERVFYEFTVSEEVEYGDQANLASDETNPTNPDKITGTTASGAVKGGTDDYRFSGDITAFNLTGGSAEVYRNGEQIDPDEIGSEEILDPVPRIDAQIVDFSPEEGAYRGGETQRAQVTVKNTGNREHTFFVGYSTIGPSGEEFNNDDSTGRTVTLAAGEQETVTVEWTAEDDAPAGAYTAVTAVWKESSGNLETDLDRAQRNSAFEIVEDTPDPRIDASILNFSPEAGIYRSGDTQQAQVTVKNTGNREHTFFVGYTTFGPNDGQFNNDDSTGQAVTLSAEERKTVTVEWNVENDAPAGTYAVQTTIWKESQGNNLETRLDGAQKSDAFEVAADTPTAPEPHIDAKIVNFSPKDGVYQPGDTQRAQATVENTGNSEHTFFVGYTTIGPNEKQFNNGDSTGRTVTLAAGERKAVSVEWTVETDAPAGTYTAVTAVWKEGSGNLETDFDRARNSNAFEVTADTPTNNNPDENGSEQKPDINGTSLSIDPFPVPAGEAPTISVEVANSTPSDTDVLINATVDGTSTKIPMEHTGGNRWEADLTDISSPDLSRLETGAKVELSITARNTRGVNALNRTKQAFPATELPTSTPAKQDLHYYIFQEVRDVPVVLFTFDGQELSDHNLDSDENVTKWEKAREYDINSFYGSSRGSMGAVGFDLVYKDNNKEFYKLSKGRKAYNSSIIRGIDTPKLISDAIDATGDPISNPVIVSHPGQNVQSAGKYPPTLGFSSIKGVYATMSFDKIYGDYYSIWAHELGHLKLGMVDLYSDGLRCYVASCVKGGIGYQGTMGRGYAEYRNNLTLPFTAISRTKLNNDESWLDLNETTQSEVLNQGSATVTVENSITDKQIGDQVQVFTTSEYEPLNGNMQYVFQGSGSDLEIFKIGKPREGPVEMARLADRLPDAGIESNPNSLNAYRTVISKSGNRITSNFLQPTAFAEFTVANNRQSKEDDFEVEIDITTGEETSRVATLNPNVEYETESSGTNVGSASSFENITKPDLDLKAVDTQGRIVGINEQGNYVNEIPGVNASGDATQGLEWIAVPGETNVTFVVSSKDVEEYMAEMNVSPSNISIQYNTSITEYGSNPQLVTVNGNLTVTNATVQAKSGSMKPGESKTIAPTAASIKLPSHPVTGESITFTASETNDSATSYEWDFDADGTADATGKRAGHTFESNGPQVVALTVTNESGVVKRVSKTISVGESGITPTNDLLSQILSTSPLLLGVFIGSIILISLGAGMIVAQRRYRP